MPHIHSELGRRERQIMDVIYARGEASVAEVLAGMPDPPSYSAVRAMLRTLVGKGHLRLRQSSRPMLTGASLVNAPASMSHSRIAPTFSGAPPTAASSASRS